MPSPMEGRDRPAEDAHIHDFARRFRDPMEAVERYLEAHREVQAFEAREGLAAAGSSAAKTV